MGNDMWNEYPLRDIPQGVLDAAREVLDGAVTWKDVHPDDAQPLADAVVMRISQYGYDFVEREEF